MKNYTKLIDIQKDIAENILSCADVVTYHLQKIQEKNDLLNVFLTVYAEEALERAKQIDAKIKAGSAGKLAGLVVGLKDVIAYENHPLQASSKILQGFISQFSATVVERLLAEDAIIIGRQNCDEFAMGSTNENSAFGATRNAANPDYVPGGSSGASTVAVQADMCQISLGSDTGGSVRQPASFCGVYGLKPTYSRISRYGLAAYASSFDCIGILGKSVEDIALVLEVIAGADNFDSTVSQKPVEAYSQKLDFEGTAKIAYLRDSVESEAIQPEIKAAMLAKIELFRQQGHQVEAIDFPLLEYILPTYYILTTAEASSNLSRYDGIRYGLRDKNAKDLEELYKKTRAEGFGKDVQRRIMLGTFVLSASYYDAYYTKAQKIRRLIKEETDKVFAQYDFWLMPTAPTTAFKLGTFKAEPLQMFLADLFTVQANVVGIPAMAFPCGEDEKGLPIGLQLSANHFQEEKLLAFIKKNI
ncbi:MAG: Asp-tRNA(Asn)/Glu-tRNA(Gln) amidotransferase subunit GatA [Thermonemataceae bacterium]|nr:Asp-tRNA(Asn)/Glu-tRNA(Gln) amidotransferase subunit GatA [Thermonemataceae bacterium]